MDRFWSSYGSGATELSSTRAKVGAELGEIQFVQVRENLAEYEPLADEKGQRIPYYIEFTRDQDEQ